MELKFDLLPTMTVYCSCVWQNIWTVFQTQLELSLTFFKWLNRLLHKHVFTCMRAIKALD